jgi:hypothetical protein
MGFRESGLLGRSQGVLVPVVRMKRRHVRRYVKLCQGRAPRLGKGSQQGRCLLRMTSSTSAYNMPNSSEASVPLHILLFEGVL